jgi:hypothetical protein
MENNKTNTEWRLLREFVRTVTHWVTFIGEQWICDKGKEIEYWRVEKVDSVIVLPIHRGMLLTAKPTFRPGVGRQTLDFPGGQLPEGTSPIDIVSILLQRELGVPTAELINIQALNTSKWNINSSFSNQGLWAFVVLIADSWSVPKSMIGLRVTADKEGSNTLLKELDCLQCRAVLIEWERKL